MMTAAGSPERVWLWADDFFAQGKPPSTNPPLKLNRLSISNESTVPERTRKKKRSDMSTEASSVPAVIPQPSTGTALARPQLRAVEGLEEFGAKDMLVPDLKLAQGTTRDSAAAPGKFYNSLDPSEHHDKLRCIALAFRHGQVYFARKEDGKPDFDGGAKCRSNDGRVPAPEIEAPISAACTDAAGEMTCPAGKWGADGKKPACATTHNLVLVDVHTLMPYRFSTNGAGLAISKKFLTLVNLKAMSKGLALFDFEFTLGVTKETGKEGAYYLPTFTDVQPVEANKYRGLYERFAPKHVEPPAKAEGDVKGAVVDSAAKASGAAPAASAPAGNGKSDAKAPPAKSGKGRDLDF